MRRLLIVLAALALAGCSTVGREKAPVCDGKHRRPANLYGSVLDPAVQPIAPAAKPDQLSAVPSASYRSCA